MINIKNLNSKKIKRNKKSYKNILVYCIGYVTVKNLRHLNYKSVNSLYLIINEINRCIEESNWMKYLTLFPTDESKDTLKIL